MYVSARGQVEHPSNYHHPSTSTSNDGERRPAKRAKTKTKDALSMPERQDSLPKVPDGVKVLYKHWQRMDQATMSARLDIIDCGLDAESKGFPRHMVRECTEELPVEVGRAVAAFEGKEGQAGPRPRVYEVRAIPGLLVSPSLLPPTTQLHLLDTLLHRDLSNPAHQTNIHLHYNVPYPPPPHANSSGPHASFFDSSAQNLAFTPKASHAPLDTAKMLDKKLRWMTLGGQYDWTNKIYPEGVPPPFPEDIRKLIQGIFPLKPEAAIVNLYSPGDTLSAHRDVAEECARPLVSISLGCEAVFIVALEAEDEAAPPSNNTTPATTNLAPTPHPNTVSAQVITNPANPKHRTATLKLRSGDAVLMSGASRFAWHGVPRVSAGTCPEFMRDWPAVGDEGSAERYGAFRGWMAGKRVNLNVRQMFGESLGAREGGDEGGEGKERVVGGAEQSAV